MVINKRNLSISTHEAQKITEGELTTIYDTTTNVLSKVRNCAVPPDHLRSEISFSRPHTRKRNMCNQ